MEFYNNETFQLSIIIGSFLFGVIYYFVYLFENKDIKIDTKPTVNRRSLKPIYDLDYRLNSKYVDLLKYGGVMKIDIENKKQTISPFSSHSKSDMIEITLIINDKELRRSFTKECNEGVIDKNVNEMFKDCLKMIDYL